MRCSCLSNSKRPSSMRWRRPDCRPPCPWTSLAAERPDGRSNLTTFRPLRLEGGDQCWLVHHELLGVPPASDDITQACLSAQRPPEMTPSPILPPDGAQARTSGSDSRPSDLASTPACGAFRGWHPHRPAHRDRGKPVWLFGEIHRYAAVGSIHRAVQRCPTPSSLRSRPSPPSAAR